MLKVITFTPAGASATASFAANDPAAANAATIVSDARAGRITLRLATAVPSGGPDARDARGGGDVLRPHTLHRTEHRDVRVDDPFAFGFVGFERPHAALRGPAEDDAVIARHHVDAEARARDRRYAAVAVIVFLRVRRA